MKTAIIEVTNCKMMPQLLDAPQDRLITLTGISWRQMEGITAPFSNVAGVKLAYLDGLLELMTTSDEHEDLKKTIAMLLEAYMRSRGIRFYGRGAPTLSDRKQNVRREPDESYNIGHKKVLPDFLIEVVITSSGIDKLTAYQRLGIPEVWFWMSGELLVYQLCGQTYRQVSRSQFLPDLDLAIIARYMTYSDQYDAITEFLQACHDSQPLEELT